MPQSETERRIHELELEFRESQQEFRECREHVGGRMLSMEKESIEKLTRLETQMVAIAASLNTFVSQHQFAPVKLIAYGLAGGVLTTFLGAILARLLGIIT